MSSTKTFTVRTTEDRHERWKLVAKSRDMSFNKWLVRAAESQAELDEAETRERAEQIVEREILKKVAFPDQGEKCKHVQKGQFCYMCNRKRW